MLARPTRTFSLPCFLFKPVVARLLLFAALCVGVTSQSSFAQTKPVEARLAENGRALLPIVVGETASNRTKAAAAILAEYLGRISGAEFEVKGSTVGNGIVVGTHAEFPALLPEKTFDAQDPTQREDYVLRSHNAGVYLIGATEQAVEHAVWDFLYRLGHRQFFPTKTWEVVPKTPNLKIAVNTREHPDYYVRRIWYSYGTWPENEPGYNQWNSRNRATAGITLNTGHAYDGILSLNKKEFEAHPEYLGLVKGERKSTKFCISNPGLRQLAVNHAIRYFQANPTADSISMDPSDGGNWCECAECAKIGSVTDRALTLANTVAEAIQQFGPKYVGMYAYNEHSPPPNIRVHPMVVISVATAFITGGYSVDELIEGWQKQGARMLGIREYYSIVAWDRDMPTARASNPTYMKTSLSKFHSRGARFMSAESSDNWGPNGLGYYVASRIMWDVKEADQLDAIISDFLDKSFGPARAPMAEYYRLLAPDPVRPMSDDLMGRLWRSLDKARKATTDPAILERINDLVLYTQYMDLYRAYTDARGADRQPAFEALIRHSYRIHRTMMVHNKGLYRDLPVRDKAMVVPAEAKWDVPETDKNGTPRNPWKSSAPFTAEELNAFVAAGIERNATVDIKEVKYSNELVPASRLGLPQVQRGSIALLRGVQNFYTWSTPGQPISLRVTGGAIYGNLGTAKVALHSGGTLDNEALQTEEVAPDKQEHAVALTPRANGLNRIRIADASAGTTIEWDATTPMTVESSLARRPVFNGRWTMYFYVPKGTKSVGGYSSGEGVLRDGANNIAHKFIDKAGYFDIPIPAGQDGKLWKFEQSIGQRLLMTVPPYLARSGEELLLPREVVQADARN